jgi:hypothetical protein
MAYHNWATLIETKEAFLTIPEGQYVIKKIWSHEYRAYFNDQPTRFLGHDIEHVMDQIDQFLTSEDLPKVHSQNGFSI